MKYKLTIIAYDKNENYEAEMAKFKEDNRFGYQNRNFNNPEYEPQIEKQTRSLEVILTEDEFKKVKAEVIKVLE